jgi:hypothetical protein
MHIYTPFYLQSYLNICKDAKFLLLRRQTHKSDALGVHYVEIFLTVQKVRVGMHGVRTQCLIKN